MHVRAFQYRNIHASVRTRIEPLHAAKYVVVWVVSRYACLHVIDGLHVGLLVLVYKCLDEITRMPLQQTPPASASDAAALSAIGKKYAYKCTGH